MPKTLSVAEAQSDFSQVVEDVCNGEDVVIVRENQALLRILPFQAPRTTNREKMLKRFTDEEWEARVAAIREVRKRAVIGPPITIDEIIAARDEGRK